MGIYNYPIEKLPNMNKYLKYRLLCNLHFILDYLKEEIWATQALENPTFIYIYNCWSISATRACTKHSAVLILFSQAHHSNLNKLIPYHM